MNRRAFVTGFGAVLAAPLGVEGQTAGKAYQVALLSTAVDSATWRVSYKPFIDAMRELNYVEGRNLVITQHSLMVTGIVFQSSRPTS